MIGLNFPLASTSWHMVESLRKTPSPPSPPSLQNHHLIFFPVKYPLLLASSTATVKKSPTKKWENFLRFLRDEFFPMIFFQPTNQPTTKRRPCVRWWNYFWLLPKLPANVPYFFSPNFTFSSFGLKWFDTNSLPLVFQKIIVLIIWSLIVHTWFIDFQKVFVKLFSKARNY